MGSLVDAFTFDVFDLDGSRDTPDGINVNVPGQTDQEKELIELQLASLKKSLEPPSEAEIALQNKMQDYYDQMMADEVLSPEEEDMFDQEYELQLSALTDKYNIEAERVGASRMAELASRGVLETTTGQDIIAQDQQKYANILGENIAELGAAKELAKSDMEAAKKQMAQQGYNLTSGILQTRQNDVLTQAGSLQNYYTGQNILNANTALQNALRNQSFNQWAYNQKMAGLGKVAGIGLGMVKSGAMG